MKIYVVLALCFFAFNAIAETTAVTNKGDIVILNEDGTWIYENEQKTNEIKLTMNPSKFSKNVNATFLLKSSKNNAAFWVNPTQWDFKKGQKPTTEYIFKNKEKEIQAMVISEEIEVEPEEIVDIALMNAKKVASDVKVVKKEYRIVNGRKVIFMQIQGTIKSIKFTYLGYYFSDESGTTQFVVFTGSNLVEKYQKDIFDFLNGATSQK